MNDLALERARSGYLLLDEHGPEGWKQRINLKNLNLADEYNCILGQVYGDYETGERRLELMDDDGNDDDALKHGFLLNMLDDADVRYSDLTEAWKFLLEEEENDAD